MSLWRRNIRRLSLVSILGKMACSPATAVGTGSKTPDRSPCQPAAVGRELCGSAREWSNARQRNPQVLARAMANLVDGQVDLDIMLRTRVFHTGADPMERLNDPPQFVGRTQPAGRYVLVADVTTMGGTPGALHPGAAWDADTAVLLGEPPGMWV